MSTVHRQRVVRADGRTMTVVQRRAHLSYRYTGCCCGRTERGCAPVPAETFKEEWLRRELDMRATLLHAVTHSGAAPIRSDDLHERVRTPHAGTRYLFVADSSGSHAVQDRMRMVEGAVSALLDSAHNRHDETVVIACRGGAARVLVEPTHVLADVQRALECLPTGGRTPLAHALEAAAAYVTDASVVVLVTDGHANVASRSDDPWADALSAAVAIRCPSPVIDSEDNRHPTSGPRELAAAMRGAYVRLADLDQASVLRVIREVS